MKSILYKLYSTARKITWTLIVAFMIGVHNFYKGDNKTQDDIVITTKIDEVQEDDRPKD